MTVLQTPPYRARAFLCKVASRCNLDCDYCYVYHYADESWRLQPRFMSTRVVTQLAARLAEYVESTGLQEIEVILHGGEPLLAGTKFLELFVGLIRAEVPCQVRFTVQTNGILLSERILECLQSLGVFVSVSLDGPAAAQNRHRTFIDGRGSFEQAAAGLKLLASSYSAIFVGILAVVDLANDPIATYEHLASYDPPSIDFLLPDANYDRPPRLPAPDLDWNSWSHWLIALFDYWYRSASTVPIRTFESIISQLLGGPTWQDNIGLGEISLLTIETDGSYHDLDVLKAIAPGEAALDMDVFGHSIEAAIAGPKVVKHFRALQLSGLSELCQKCPVVSICGGGYYPHRFSTATGFNNPSVYCSELFRVIVHVYNAVQQDLAEAGIAIAG